MLAAVFAARTYRHMLFGATVTLVTDHEPLKYLLDSPELTGQHAQWALMIQELHLTIMHRPGVRRTPERGHAVAVPSACISRLYRRQA